MFKIAKWLFVVAIIALAKIATAQTLVVNPNAEGGFELGNTFNTNGWTVVNNINANTGNNWYLASNTLSNGGFIFEPTGNRAAYISQANNGNWSYNFNQHSTTHIYRTVTFPPGQENITLKFRWNADGEGPIYDVLYVYSCPTTLTPIIGQPFGTSNSTNSWSGSGTANLHATLHTSNEFTGNTATVTLPATYAGTNRKLVFTWKNGSTLGSQPPAAIDSIWLFADCHKPSITTTNTATPCSGNFAITATVVNATANGNFNWYVNGTLMNSGTNATYASSSLVTGDVVRCIYNANNACNYKDTADFLIQLNVNSTKTEYLTVCSQTLPTTWRGVNIPTSAQSNINFATVNVASPSGCDSIITLNLQVLPSPPVTTENISVCRGQLTQTQWRGRNFSNSAQSSYRFDSIIVESPNGCDSLIYLSLNVMETATIIRNTIESCDPIVFDNNLYTQSITLYDTIRGLSHCDSIVNITDIVIAPFEINLQLRPPVQYLEGNPISLRINGNNSIFDIISWQPQHLFLNQNATYQNINGPKEATISVVAKNAIGCLDTAYLDIKAYNLTKDYIIPNAFSPNGDGKNDVFAPIFKVKEDFEIVSFEIYNRWGQRVFSTYNGNGVNGWDGYINGKIADVGLYYYILNIKFKDGTTESAKGEVHLIR